MPILNLQASFFAIDNPLRLLERCFNRFQHRQSIRINQRELEVRWTERAERELRSARQPLVVELQLYFSCVVKKRVVFHQQVDFESTAVTRQLKIAFRPVASAVCDPREFAASYPQARNLSAGPAAGMVPKSVEIDFRRGCWQGDFSY